MTINTAGLLYAAQEAALARINELHACQYSPSVDVSLTSHTGSKVVSITISESNDECVSDELMMVWLRVVLKHLDGPVSDETLKRVFSGGESHGSYFTASIPFEG